MQTGWREGWLIALSLAVFFLFPWNAESLQAQDYGLRKADIAIEGMT